MLRMVHGLMVSAFQLWSGTVRERAGQEQGLLMARRVVARITSAQESRALKRWLDLVADDKRRETEEKRILVSCTVRMLDAKLGGGFRTWTHSVSMAKHKSRCDHRVV